MIEQCVHAIFKNYFVIANYLGYSELPIINAQLFISNLSI